MKIGIPATSTRESAVGDFGFMAEPRNESWHRGDEIQKHFTQRAQRVRRKTTGIKLGQQD
jgi:hypothetical protein